jgi:hypothetical protein
MRKIYYAKIYYASVVYSAANVGNGSNQTNLDSYPSNKYKDLLGHFCAIMFAHVCTKNWTDAESLHPSAICIHFTVGVPSFLTRYFKSVVVSGSFLCHLCFFTLYRAIISVIYVSFLLFYIKKS